MANFVPWLTSKLGAAGIGRRPKLKGRAFQESIDTTKALHLMMGRRLGGEEIPVEVPALSKDEIDKLSLDRRKEMLRKESITQLLSMFQALHECAGCPEAETVLRKRQLQQNQNPDLYPLATSMKEPQLLLDPAHDVLLQKCGFMIRPGQSLIEGAGLGAFLDGGCEAGTLVALYPGVVFHSSNLLRDAGVIESLSPDEHLHLFSRYDGVIIDARGATPSPLTETDERERVESCQELRGRNPKKSPPNPFAIAHLANHPPLGTEPNTMMIAVDFPSNQFGTLAGEFPSIFLPMVPNVLDTAHSILKGTYNPGVAMQSAALITTSKIDPGAELTLNYRLSPLAERPSWYEPVDTSEEERMWADAAKDE
mmetsp:Transcript_55467/g.109972  ORF Transcript_55467/g.109972 Transcript_55467/m.109972 type:complete len:367 (-) Transcript_55467:312-1412(-)